MEDKSSNIEALIEKAGDYAETRFDLLKMQFVNKSSDVVSSLVTKFVILVIVFLFLLIVNIGISLWLGELTGKLYYGFFIVGGFYAITGLIFYAGRHKWIKDPVGEFHYPKSIQMINMEINNSLDLREAIAFLESKRKKQEQDLSVQFKNTYQSLQPINILKDTWQGITASPQAKGRLLKAGLGLGAGLLSRKIFFGQSGTAVKKLLATAVEFGVARTVASKSGNIAAKGLNMIRNLLHKRTRNDRVSDLQN